MATGLVCNVVHLAQQPPPVPVLLDGMAMPRPLPTRYSLAQRLARHRHGAYRWRRPDFHPSQVKAWALDPQLEEELRESLVVMGPQALVHTPQRLTSSALVTAPPASLQSSLDSEEQDEEHKEDSKMPQSNFSFKDLVPRYTEDAVTVFPVRPPISGGKDRKQIPGRLFSKPTLTEDQTDQLGYFLHAKPSMASRPHSWFPAHKSNTRDEQPINLALCVTHHSHHYDPPVFKQNVAVQLHQDIVLRPRIFTVRSNRKAVEKAKNCVAESLDSNSTKCFMKLPLTRLGRTSESNSDFAAVVVHGQRKHLHTKPVLLDPEQTDSAEKSGEQAAVSSDTLTKPKEPQPHKIATIETDELDTTVAGHIHAPLNSPTDQKDGSFPELT